MDKLELFQMTDSIKSFLLLDRYGGILDMPFLSYINNPKDHWVISFGIPYGTALWQIGDSEEQNDSFKIALKSENDEVLERKEGFDITDGVKDIDMIPIINLTSLNFNSILPSFCLKSIISQEQIHGTHERISEDLSTDKEFKELLKELKHITLGIIFKAGSVCLEITVFDIHMENQGHKRKESITKMKKDEKEYYDNVEKGKAVFEKKSDP